MKVLIVDPDWRFAQQASTYLESRADSVAHQPNPQQALAHAQRWQPDLVLVSAELGEGGLVDELMRMDVRPAILLTEYLDRYDRAWRVWQRGGDDLLVKPILDADEFRLSARTALENAATGRRDHRRAVASA